MSNYTYPEDRTGHKASNRITGEQHTLTPDNTRNYHFIIPKFAPFFGQSIKVFKSINDTLLQLKEGVDYHLSLEYVSATLSTGKGVYGGISFVNLNLDGTIVLEYQTIGGKWTLDTQKMLEVIANIVFNPRGLTWDQINGKPETFGPTDHTFDFNNLLTEKQLGDKITGIRDAILEKSKQKSNHEDRIDNPHNVTAEQLELGAFSGKTIATIKEAMDGNSNDKVITASTLKAVLSTLGLLDVANTVKTFKQHLEDKSNPHELTTSYLNLDLIENLPVATSSDVLGKKKVKKYVTLDNLIDFIRIHGCSTSEKESKKYPPKDSLLRAYCKVRDNMGIFADGFGNTYEKIIELNSPQCGYVPPPSKPQYPAKGTIMTRYCVGFDQYGLYADGYGGQYANLISINNPSCGYTGNAGSNNNTPPTNHPAAGTILGQYCDGSTQVITRANGQGGQYEDRVRNSPNCASIANHPPAGTLMSTYCAGFNQMGRYADGNGDTYNAVVQVNSTQCGYVASVPNPPPNNNPPPSSGGKNIELRINKKSLTYTNSSMTTDFEILGYNLEGNEGGYRFYAAFRGNEYQIGISTSSTNKIGNTNVRSIKGVLYIDELGFIKDMLKGQGLSEVNFDVFAKLSTIQSNAIGIQVKNNEVANTPNPPPYNPPPNNPPPYNPPPYTPPTRPNPPPYNPPPSGGGSGGAYEPEVGGGGPPYRDPKRLSLQIGASSVALGETINFTADASHFEPGEYDMWLLIPGFVNLPFYTVKPGEAPKIHIGANGQGRWVWAKPITIEDFNRSEAGRAGAKSINLTYAAEINGHRSNTVNFTITRTSSSPDSVGVDPTPRLSFSVNKSVVKTQDTINYTVRLNGGKPGKTYNILYKASHSRTGEVHTKTKSITADAHGNGGFEDPIYVDGTLAGWGVTQNWMEIENTSVRSETVLVTYL